MVKYEFKVKALTLIVHTKQTQPWERCKGRKLAKKKNIKHAMEGFLPQVFYVKNSIQKTRFH